MKIKTCFPPKEEALRFMAFALVVTNLMALLGFANNAGAFVLRFSLGEMLIILAYTLPYALLEAGFVGLLLALLGMALPKSWLREKFSTHGTVFYLIGTLALYPWIGFTSKESLNHLFILADYLPQPGLFIVVWAVLWAGFLYLILRILKNEQAEKKFHAFIGRFGTLAMLYLILDCAAVLTVIVRMLL